MRTHASDEPPSTDKTPPKGKAEVSRRGFASTVGNVLIYAGWGYVGYDLIQVLMLQRVFSFYLPDL